MSRQRLPVLTDLEGSKPTAEGGQALALPPLPLKKQHAYTEATPLELSG